MSAEDEARIFQQARSTADAETDTDGREAVPAEPGDRYTLAHDWTLTANTGPSAETVAMIRDGPAVRVDHVTARLESGSDTSVRFHLRSGERRIAPERGAFTTGDDTYEAAARAVLSPDDDLVARWENTTSTDRFAVVYVDVEVVG